MCLIGLYIPVHTLLSTKHLYGTYSSLYPQFTTNKKINSHVLLYISFCQSWSIHKSVQFSRSRLLVSASNSKWFSMALLAIDRTKRAKHTTMQIHSRHFSCPIIELWGNSLGFAAISTSIYFLFSSTHRTSSLADDISNG